MPIYKPLHSMPRVQKAYVPIMVLTVLSVIADVAELVTTLLYANSIEIQSTNEWVPLTFLLIGLLCKFIGATWFLVAAIADTADHDHTFNLPVFMGFVACCIPPLTILLPFVFLHMLISNNQDIVKRDLIKEKVLLWAWAGCYFFASSVSVFVDFESMGIEDAPTPFSDIIDATFWGLGGILSIIAIQAITAAITETRKVVIRVSAQRLNQAPPQPGQPNLGQWDPDDPFRPRF